MTFLSCGRIDRNVSFFLLLSFCYFIKRERFFSKTYGRQRLREGLRESIRLVCQYSNKITYCLSVILKVSLTCHFVRNEKCNDVDDLLANAASITWAPCFGLYGVYFFDLLLLALTWKWIQPLCIGLASFISWNLLFFLTPLFFFCFVFFTLNSLPRMQVGHVSRRQPFVVLVPMWPWCPVWFSWLSSFSHRPWAPSFRPLAARQPSSLRHQF